MSFDYFSKRRMQYFLEKLKDIFDTKVDKVSGKGLSTNDYTTTEKNKLAGIAAGAEVNVQSDWNQATTTADDYIKNKPTIPTVNNGTLTITQNGTSKGTFTANQSGNSTIALTDTTYSSKAAASGGTDVSLVTTGEKYTWNNKSNLALGTTSSTAFRGDYGNSSYAHAVTNKGSAFSSGLYKITTNSEGHVTAATAVAKADITALGIPGSDTNNRKAFFGTCDTAAATAAKAVTLSDTSGWELKAGTIIGIKFTNSNSASSVTLNVNGSGAKSIYYNGSVFTGNTSWITGQGGNIIFYMYDGTNWVWMNFGWHSDGNNNVTQTATTTNADYEVLFSVTADNTTRTEAARKNSNLKFNPSTGNLQATQLNGVTIGSSPKFTDTNTWRPVVDNLTSTETAQSLSANQGRLLANGSARDSTKLPLSGGTITGRVTNQKPITRVITGSGTAAQDKGSGVSPRYFPAKWTFNTGLNPTDGDIIAIKIPVAGHDYGVYLSINNGSTYHPVVLMSNGRITTHFPNGKRIMLVYEADGAADNVFALNGGDTRTNVTGGAWRVINFYDTNTDIRAQAYCDTAAATAAKVASSTNYRLRSNSYILLNLVNANSVASALTLNVNGQGAKPIYINGSASSATNYTLPAGTYFVFYNGTNYYFRTDAWAITGDIAGTALYAKYISSDSKMTYGWNGVNYFNANLTAGHAAKANDSPTTAWWHILRFNHGNSAGFYTDLAIPFNDTSLYYKRITSGAVQNNGWVKVYDALNLTSKAAAASGTDLSLVTTGEKATWNAKGSGTVTQVKVGSTAYNPTSGVISLPAYPTDTNTHRPIQMNGTEILGNNTTALNLKAGSNVSLSNSSGTVTIAATNSVASVQYVGTASATEVRMQAIDNGISTTSGIAAYMQQSKILSTSANTVFTFTNAAILASSVVEVYSSIFGMNPISVSCASGSCTVTFPPYTSATSLTCRIDLKWT